MVKREKPDGTYIYILGTKYEIERVLQTADVKLEQCDGYCDTTEKRIVGRWFAPDELENEMVVGDIGAYECKCLRHEIVHAFLYESGLSVNTQETDCWATCEEVVDWVAIQGAKIYAAWKDAGCV